MSINREMENQVFNIVTLNKEEILETFQLKSSYYYKVENNTYVIYEKLINKNNTAKVQDLEEVQEEIYTYNQNLILRNIKAYENVISTVVFRLKNWFGFKSALTIKERYELNKEKYEHSLSTINKESFIESIPVNRKLKEESKLFEMIEDYRDVYLIKYDNYQEEDFLKIIPFEIKGRKIIHPDFKDEDSAVDFDICYYAKEKNRNKNLYELQNIVFDVRATKEGKPYINFAPYKQEIFVNESEAVEFLKEMVKKNPQLKKHLQKRA